MKLSEIDYSNNFNDLYIDLKNYINTDNHVVFLDSNLSSILNLDENLNIFEIDINESTKGLETIQKLWSIMFDQSLDRNSKVVWEYENPMIHHDFIRLEDHGIKGNGHMMMHEKNSREAVSYTHLTLPTKRIV